MDPKTANLDPKLKEAYERIMGTAVPTPVQKVNTQTPGNPQAKPVESTPLQTPKLQVHEVSPEPLNVPAFEPPPPLPPQPQPEAPSNEMVQSPVFNVSKNNFSQPLPPPADISENNTNTNLNEASPRKKGKFMKIFLLLGGLIFFVLYGVIWARIFNLF